MVYFFQADAFFCIENSEFWSFFLREFTHFLVPSLQCGVAEILTNIRYGDGEELTLTRRRKKGNYNVVAIYCRFLEFS